MPGSNDDPEGFSDRFQTIIDLVLHAIGDAGEVLVIDDENSVRMSLVMLLQPYYQVHTAENSAQALRILTERNIDLVTLDMAIPGIQGDELLPYIRAIRSNVEVILLTSSLTFKNAVSGIHYGAQDYFSKPFDIVDFLYATQTAVKKKKALDGYTVLLKQVGGHLEEETHQAMERLIDFVDGRRWIRGGTADIA